MDFRMLGPLAAFVGDEVVALGGPKQRTVLALLLVNANKVVTTDRLIDELYGQEPPDAARKSLQSYIANLRKVVNTDQELLHGRPPGYVLEVDSSQIDGLVFERLVHQARGMLDGDPAGARERLTEALGLWYGAPLIDVADEAPSLRQEVTRLTELRLSAIEDRLDADLALGQHQAAAAEVESLIAENPFRERLWGQLMLALYRSGRQAEALRTYQKARRTLGEELGIEPSPALRALEDRILNHDADLDPRQPPAISVEPAPGRTVRGYELRERIGDGRLGVVYRAYQPVMGREVALEVIRPDIASSADFARHFEADATLIARLEHPHIVPLYDYWREPGGAFVVSRWVRGGSLETAIQKGPWHLEAVVGLVEQLGSALSLALRHGVVHGSLDASNVLLDEDGNGYLSGFSIGIGAGRDAAAEPWGHVADPRADVRALALVAFEALTGGADGPITEAPLGEFDPDVLAVLRRASVSSGEDGYPDIVAFIDAFAAAASPKTPAAFTAAPPSLLRNPYKSLRPFGEADASDFFGREALTERLMGRLGESDTNHRFLAVVGPSGSGKSSVVRAGLVPAIRRGDLEGSDRWFVVEMLPGLNPWEELEAALLRVAVNPPPSLLDQLTSDALGLHRAVKRVLPDGEAQLLLIVDQFEELFTLVDDWSTRAGFMDALAAAVGATGSQLRIVVTLRADFFDRPLRHSGMGALVTHRMETVRPLTAEELERAVAGPVERVGVGFEPGLKARIAADVADQPGALPLLQYTLTELFDRREGATLTVDGYQSLGGVEGALGQRAEELYASLDRDAQAAAQQLFLRLVALGEGTSDTRRRVMRSELAAIEGQRRGIEIVLETFGAQRLLSFDRDPITRSPTVEVAHEALLREWPRLSDWIDEGRADLRDEKALAAAAAEWQASGRDSSYLLTGERLRRFELWHETSKLALTRAENDFLDFSLQARQAAETLEGERLRREAMLERRSRTRLRLFVALLAVASIVAVSLTLVAQNQTRDAERNLAISTARALTAESIQALEVDAELSMLLAVEAADIALVASGEVLPETVEALHRALLASRIVFSVPGGSGAFNPDGSRLATADPGTAFAGGVAEGGARVYSSSGEELLVLRGHSGRTLEALYSADGTMIATTGLDGTARLWDASTGTEIRVLEVPGVVLLGADFSRDGRVLAVSGSDDAVRLWDVSSGEIRVLTGIGDAVDISFSNSGSVAVAADTAGVFVIDAASGEQLLHLTGHSGGTCRVEFSPDDTLLASASQDGTARLWDPATGTELRSLAGHAGPVCGMAFSPDGGWLATGGEDGMARLWDTETGEELLAVSGHAAGIGAVAFDPSGRLMATAGGDGLTKVWDVSPGGSHELITVATGGSATFSAYTADGALLATGTADGDVEVWNAETGERRAQMNGHTARITGGGFSPDGSMLVTSGEDRTARVWDVASGGELFAVTAHTDSVWSSTVSPDGTVVATGGLDGLAALWSVPQGREVARLEGIPAAFSVVFSPDGSLLAVVGIGIQIWDVDSVTRIAGIEGHSGAILSAEFGPDGMVLATAAADGSAKLWDVSDVQSGEILELVSLQGHSGAVLDVALSADANRIATASLDNSVKIWSSSGGELLTLPVRMPGIVAFDPTGTRLAVPSADGSVRVYVLPADELLDLARSRLTRSFTPAECDRYLPGEACPTS
jgi:WD40 repeat protein/DNA-binding SARP family transcriptional activator